MTMHELIISLSIENKLIIVTPRVHNFMRDKLNKEDPTLAIPKGISFTYAGLRVEPGYSNSDEIIIDLIKMLTK